MAKSQNQIQQYEADEFDQVLEDVQQEADAILANAPDDEERRSVMYLEYYVKKMGELSDMQTRVKTQYKVLVNQLKNRLSALTYCMGGQAQEITEAMIAKQGGKKRSIDTLYGRAGLRSNPGSVRVSDEAAFFEWLDAQPVSVSGRLDDCIERKVARTSAIKAFIEDTGEVPPGVTYTQAHDKFYPAAERRRLEVDTYG